MPVGELELETVMPVVEVHDRGHGLEQAPELRLHRWRWRGASVSFFAHLQGL